MPKDKGKCVEGPAIVGGTLGAVAGAIIGGILAGPLGAVAGGVLGAGGGSLIGIGIGLLACWLQETFGGSGGSSKPKWDYATPRFTKLETNTYTPTVKEDQKAIISVLTSVVGNDDRATCKVTYDFTAEEGNPATDKISFETTSPDFSRASPAFMPKWAKHHDGREVKCIKVTLEATKKGQTYETSQENISPTLFITIVPK